MRKAYVEIPELTDEEFVKISEAKNAFFELKKIIPSASAYRTCFAHNGKIYHTDTNGGQEECKLDVLYHELGEVVDYIPTREVVVEVQKPNTYSESLLLKAISAASLGYSGVEA